MKRRHSSNLHINIDGSDSGVPGFPLINDPSTQILMCITQTTVEHDTDGEEWQVLYGYDATTRIDDEDVTRSTNLTVTVRDFWCDSPFPVGSIVRLIAPLRKSEQVFEVNAEHGVIVTDPNTLISCTTMAGMTFCPRKTVLSDRFRGSCSSFAMLLGTIVHELFQKCLINKPKVISRQYLFNEYRIHHIAEVCVELVALGETLAHFEVELMVYLESVSRWLREYAPSRRSASGSLATVTSPSVKHSPLVRHSTVCLNAIVDIEDNVWSPTLGVKGKIDVSFKSHTSPDIMPLELKTGKPHFVEHLSQVMLYSLMYSETMNNGRIAPGFLLYMKDNTVRQIAPKIAELKGVLHMRNRVAPYFSRLAIDGFPKPLQEKRMCGYCEHSTTCAVLNRLNTAPPTPTAKIVVEMDVTNDRLFRYGAVTQEMADFLGDQVAHLQDCDLEYAERWLRRVFEQWTACKRKSKMERVFFDPPVVRELDGTCLTNMKLDSATRTEDGKYQLKFIKNNGDSLGNTKFHVDNFIIVSTAKHCAIYLHVVSAIDANSITITSNKLYIRTRVNDNVTYTIDVYDSYTAFGVRLGNVAMLMSDNERMAKLRSLIIARRKPAFGAMSKEGRLAFVTVKGQLDPTCKNQGVALMNALKLEDYMIVHGENEADRLRTAILMIQCFLKKNLSVLLTAKSWEALDAGALQLLEHVDERDLLRIAAPFNSDLTAGCATRLQGLRLEAKMSTLDERNSVEYFDATRDLLMSTRLIMSPCAKVSSHSIFSLRSFDVCVVLDAHSIAEPSLIRPLMQGNSFVLVGDLEDISSVGENDNVVEPLMRQLADTHPSSVTRLGKV